MGSECSSHQQAIKQSSNLSHPAFTSDPPCALSKWSLKCAHKQSRSLLKSQIYPLWIMKQKAKTNAHQWPINIFGWWFQPLWKILVSWDDYSQYMEEMFQTTNQIYIYIYIFFERSASPQLPGTFAGHLFDLQPPGHCGRPGWRQRPAFYNIAIWKCGKAWESQAFICFYNIHWFSTVISINTNH